MSEQKEQVLRKMVGSIVKAYESNTYVSIGKTFQGKPCNVRVDTKVFGLPENSLPAAGSTFELEMDSDVSVVQTVNKQTGEVGHVIVTPTFKAVTSPKVEKKISLDALSNVEPQVQQPAAPEAGDDTDTDIPF